VRFKTSVGEAKASVPAPVVTKFNEFRFRAEVPVDTVPVDEALVKEPPVDG
jgi:hypothetical protein